MPDFDNNISSAIAQYVYTQSTGNVTEPVNGSYIQAYCEYLGITSPLNTSWLQALCNHFGITQPLYGSWLIALANYYGITTPVPYGTWWMALAFADGTPLILPVADFTSDFTTVNEGSFIQFTDTSTVGVGGTAITAWAWTFTGGTPSTSTSQNPSIVYNTAGNYEVSLQVTNDDGSDTKTVPNYITVEVVPLPAVVNNFRTSYYGQTTTEPNYAEYETNYYYQAQ